MSGDSLCCTSFPQCPHVVDVALAEMAKSFPPGENVKSIVRRTDVEAVIRILARAPAWASIDWTRWESGIVAVRWTEHPGQAKLFGGEA